MMKKLIIICAVVGLMFVIGTPVANAALNYGTPSPSLSPTFGTLVNFDDKAVGTAVGQFDYVSLGVASILETEGLGFFGRYDGSQSMPCYVGTGEDGERGTDADDGWDGTIVIDLAQPADMIGIGVADSGGGSEILSVYDSFGALLESHTLTTGINIYAYITRPSSDIARIQIYGDFFAIDDLQFTPEPATICLLGLGGLALLRKRRP